MTEPKSIPLKSLRESEDAIPPCSPDCNSRLVQFLTNSPQLGGSPVQATLDDSTIPRTLRPSASIDINESISLDVKNESKVR